MQTWTPVLAAVLVTGLSHSRTRTVQAATRRPHPTSFIYRTGNPHLFDSGSWHYWRTNPTRTTAPGQTDSSRLALTCATGRHGFTHAHAFAPHLPTARYTPTCDSGWLSRRHGLLHPVSLPRHIMVRPSPPHLPPSRTTGTFTPPHSLFYVPRPSIIRLAARGLP